MSTTPDSIASSTSSIDVTRPRDAEHGQVTCGVANALHVAPIELLGQQIVGHAEMHLVRFYGDIEVEEVEQFQLDQTLDDLRVVRLRQTARLVDQLRPAFKRIPTARSDPTPARAACRHSTRKRIAVLEAATVLIRPPVEVRREERLAEHAVRAVNHDPVVSGFREVPRRDAVRLHDLVDGLQVHLVGHVEVVGRLHRRWAEQRRVRAAGLVAPDVPDPRVVDLCEQLCPCGACTPSATALNDGIVRSR